MDQDGGNWFEPRRVVSRWWVLPLVGVIAAGVALLVSQRVPSASSNATYVLSAATEIDNPFDVSSSLSVLRGREVISTFADILESSTVRDAAAEQVGGPVTNRYSAEATVLPGSNIVKLSVTGPAAGVVQEVASSIGEVATSRFAELYPIYRIEILDAASPPARSTSVTIRNMFIAAVAGMAAAGLIIAVIPVAHARDDVEHGKLEPVPLLDTPLGDAGEIDAPGDAPHPPDEDQGVEGQEEQVVVWRWRGQAG